jgi:proline dehydrogenase
VSLNIENTEIAFQAKSDAELRRSYWLYSLLNNRALSKLGEASVKLSLKLYLPIEPIIRMTIFRQFCGGETMESCRRVVHELAHFHIGTVLDYSVEGAHDEASFEHTAAEIKKTIEFATQESSIDFCVFKISGIAPLEILEKKSTGTIRAPEKSEWQKVYDRTHSICALAHARNIRLFIDAEESWIQPAIDELADEMMAKFNRERAIIYNTLQMYRCDRPEFLRRSRERAVQGKYHLGVKLVRGAYMEKERARAQSKGIPSPIFENKAATDRAYDEALAYCVEHLSHVALVAGTHNENSTTRLAEWLGRNQIERHDPRVYFAQLYGMGDHLTYNLAAGGYHTAKYLPYGPVRSVMPYLFRRAEENTSIQGQSGRELTLISRELERRRGHRHASVTNPKSI